MTYSTSHILKEKARELGFSMLGITRAEPSPRVEQYLQWIRKGMHGTMDYMARGERVARRLDLNLVLPGARSLIVVAQDYPSANLPPDVVTDRARGRISNYAWGIDYHTQMLPRLEILAQIVRQAEQDVVTRAYVDTGAILERSHAEQAQLGFVGKNTMLIHPGRGSYFFLGEIITSLEMDYDDEPETRMPGCGTCTRCLTACPTKAFPLPYVLDARRCVSYLTIEHKGFIPVELRPKMSNWVYGCDICQEVCPWQRFAPITQRTEDASAALDRVGPPLTSLLQLTDAAFQDRFFGTAIYRIRRERLVRNACIAAGNSEIGDMSEWLLPLLHDDSPIVRGHAAWALGHLREAKDSLINAATSELDPEVRFEIDRAMIECEA